MKPFRLYERFSHSDALDEYKAIALNMIFWITDWPRDWRKRFVNSPPPFY
jgi:hypothetical protein